MVISKIEQKTVVVSYYVEITEEYLLDILKEQNYSAAAIRMAITSQFSKSRLVKEYDELSKHEWTYKDIAAEGKKIYRISYLVETEEQINY